MCLETPGNKIVPTCGLMASLLAEREEYRNVAIPTEENEEKQLH